MSSKPTKMGSVFLVNAPNWMVLPTGGGSGWSTGNTVIFKRALMAIYPHLLAQFARIIIMGLMVAHAW